MPARAGQLGGPSAAAVTDVSCRQPTCAFRWARSQPLPCQCWTSSTILHKTPGCAAGSPPRVSATGADRLYAPNPSCGQVAADGSGGVRLASDIARDVTQLLEHDGLLEAGEVTGAGALLGAPAPPATCCRFCWGHRPL